MQKHVPMTVKRSISKSEVEFQHGSRLFSETVSNNISSMHWDICPKFGMRIAFYLQKRDTSPNQKPEVDLWRYGHYLRKSIWRQNSVDNHLIFTKFGTSKWNHMPITAERSISKNKIKFQHGSRLFSETGSSNISAVDWDICSKFVMPIVLDK